MRHLFFIPALLGAAASLAPANAQEADTSPGLAVKFGGLLNAKGEPVNSGQVGARFLSDISVLNISDAPVTLRRFQIAGIENLNLLPIGSDFIDNDKDGRVDDENEADFSPQRGVRMINLGLEGLVIEPGQSVTRRIGFDIREDSKPGRRAKIQVFTGGRLQGDRQGSSLVKTRASGEIQIRGAAIRTSVSKTIMQPGEEAALSAIVSLAPGTYRDVSFLVSAPDSIDIGQGVITPFEESGECVPVADGATEYGELRFMLESCDVALGETKGFKINWDVAYLDPDNALSTEDVIAWRDPTLTFSLRDRGDVIATSVETFSAAGIQVISELVDQSEEVIPAGGTFAARYRYANLGDEPLEEGRFSIDPNSIFECGSAELNSGDESRRVDAYSCSLDGPLVEALAPGEEIEFNLSLTIREDAVLSAGQVSPGWLIGSDGKRRSLAPISISYELPKALAFSLPDQPEQGALQNEPRQPFSVNLNGDLPAGRFDADFVIIARLVERDSGDPIGPAEVEFTKGALAVGDNAPVERLPVAEGESEDGLWGRYSLPIRRSTDGSAARDWAFNGEARLASLPIKEAGDFTIEMGAEVLSHGGNGVPSLDWPRVDIVHPSLEAALILRVNSGSPDAIGLVCNRGRAAAGAVSFGLDLPADFQGEDFRAVSELEISQVLDLRETAKVIFADVQQLKSASLNDISIAPMRCAAIRALSSAPSRNWEEKEVSLNVSEHSGENDPDGLIYQALSVSEEFDINPDANVESRSRSVVTSEGRIEHEIHLEAPVSGGPHQVEMGLDSSTDLPWTVLRETATRSPELWVNGLLVGDGERITIKFEGWAPVGRREDWQDLTELAIRLNPKEGEPVLMKSELVTVAEETPSRLLETSRMLFLDRDCDGDISDEVLKDALGEASKALGVTDCAQVSIFYNYTGERAGERLIIEDAIPKGVRLVNPELEEQGGFEPEYDPETQRIEWRREGLAEPGLMGNISYSIRVANGD